MYHLRNPRSIFISFGASILTVVNNDFVCPSAMSRFQINDDGDFFSGSGSFFCEIIILSSCGCGFGSSTRTLIGVVLEFLISMRQCQVNVCLSCKKVISPDFLESNCIFAVTWGSIPKNIFDSRPANENSRFPKLRHPQ